MVSMIGQVEPRKFALVSVHNVMKITAYALMCMTAIALSIVAIAWMNTPVAKHDSGRKEFESLSYMTHTLSHITHESHLLNYATQYGGEQCDFFCSDSCIVSYPVDRSDLARCIENCAINCIADANGVIWGTSLQERFLSCVASYYHVV